MSYDIKLDFLPSGVALTSGREGDQVTVAIREFSSSEDGDTFIQRLEGIPSDFLDKLRIKPEINPSVIDHMLVVVRKDKTATIYINELPFLMQIRVKQAKRASEKGGVK